MFQMPMRCAASTQSCAMHMRRSIAGMWTGWGFNQWTPPCTGAARIGDSGEQLPCVPCAAVPSHPTMCVWMREERNADSSTPHFKLRFMNLTKCANGYRADKCNGKAKKR